MVFGFHYMTKLFSVDMVITVKKDTIQSKIMGGCMAIFI